jgi:YVTN family beta-propeller protein
VNEIDELREWCEAVPSPAPAQLAKAQGRLDAAIAREADRPRRAAPGSQTFQPARWRRSGWLAPLASAVAVIAIVVGTFVVAGAVHGARSDHAHAAASTYPGLVCILSQGGILTRIRDGRVLAPIHVPASAEGVAVTPDGRTAYLTETRGENRDGVVIPVQLTTGRVLPPIRVGIEPTDIAVTANGKTAYVTNFGSGTVTPIATATNTALAPIHVGSTPNHVIVTSDGRTLYVLSTDDQTITPVRTATGTALHPIPIPGLVAVAPGSKSGYVIASVRRNSGTLTPIQGDRTLKPIVVPLTPVGLTIGPDGKTAYVVSAKLFGRAGRSGDRFTITPIDLADGARLRSVTVRGSSNGSGIFVISPGGKTGYFLDTMLGAVIPIDLGAGSVGMPIPTGNGPYHGGPEDLLFGQGASIGYLIKSDLVVPLNSATNTTLRPIKLPAIIGWSEAVR